ncbi:hypothetical protein EPUS_01969 [Endocarpon pusillum Z07020]|uniref:Heterokaryon incompatibility domain-containing protein n=1 Tax=Endocarpon pusillum (strain Z07020 / HMAS-L-300199) TaxID=1263415 RepID=U1G9W1_ENDPU|nr:uncharacterized protein EPUS_01969 [Endocarpon pusillum Z07020]ERF74282.1 hypothetical protein EPUS_01969 [Endocarpon pusillum Z07020]
MLGLQNKARRKAVESRKSSDSNPPTRNSASNSTGFFSGILANFQPQSDGSELQSRSVCGSNCWARQADLQKPENFLITPLRLDDPDQDQVAALNGRVYESLRPWQTRLIVLQPGELGSDVSCKLVSVDVIDGPGLGISGTSDIVAYEALSYAWGNPALLYSISCNERQFGVTEELAFALQYLRLRDAERYLWCDAICINQQDLLEKAHQVKNMLRTFEKADRVVAWLGRPLPTSAKLFKAIELVGPSSGRDPPQKHQDGCAAAIRNVALAVSKQLESAWFRRAWIRQEVYAAKKLILQTGHLQSDFMDFTSSLARMQMTLASFDASQDRSRIPSTLETYQNEYQHLGSDRPSFKPKGERPTYVQYWLDSINTGLWFDVTNERDRIYGMLGLLTSKTVKFFAEVPEELEKMAEAFPIDYSKSLSGVHEDVTKFLINTTKTLEILDIFQDKGHSGSPGRPSWNSDFSRKQERYFLPEPPSQVKKDMVKVNMQDHLDVGRLRLAGVRVAKYIQRLDGEKEIGHPQDRFIPKYRRSITLRHIMQGPQRRSSGSLSSGIDNPPYAFVFSYAKESEQNHDVSISHHLSKFEDMDAPFARFLSGIKFAFAYVDDLEGTKSFDLASLHFLMPRTASLNDTIVSLYGSKCLHLIRSLHTDPPEWTYIGPIAAVAIGQESIIKYQSAGLSGSSSKMASKDVKVQDTQQAEIFVLR